MKVSQPVSITKFIKANELTFEIPVYQRNYAWDIDNCDKLFDDVLMGIQAKRKHYFGNIVYYEASEQLIIGFDRYILIDGQQRITSTMLLLAAIRDEEDDETIRTKLTATYLTNEEAEEKSRVKLKQVESDRATYESIITGDTEDILKSSLVYRNYNRFRRLVKNVKHNQGYTTTDLLSGIEFLDIIAIDLESEKVGSESPQVIFESINATGKPLSTADLLRNFLLLEIGVDDQKEYYEKYWLTIEKNVGSDSISDFIRRFITMKSNDDVKKDSEYREFKKYYSKLFTSADAAIKELSKYSKYYSWIKQPEKIISQQEATAKILADLDDLRMLPATPVIMWLLAKADSGDVSYEEINSTLQVIASWSFRARITNIVPTGEIGTILTTKILELLKSKKDDITYPEFLVFELSNYRLHDIYPTDEMFVDAFVRYDFYKNYRRYVQQKLASEISNDKTEITLESIEHIMPQTISHDKWPGVQGHEHIEWVNTIGNLTPLNLPDNISNSNHAFKDKVDNISKSDWQITREVMNFVTDGWGIEEIRSRANELAAKATEIWTGPVERTREIELAMTSSQANTRRIIKLIEDLSMPHIIIDREMSAKNYVRFSSETMDRIIPPLEDESGAWHTGRAYYYEITNKGTRLQIALSPDVGSEEQKEGQDQVLKVLNKPKMPGKWVTKSWKLDHNDDGEITEDDLYVALEETIPQFEQMVVEQHADF